MFERTTIERKKKKTFEGSEKSAEAIVAEISVKGRTKERKEPLET
jgi:hypothetical protein